MVRWQRDLFATWSYPVRMKALFQITCFVMVAGVALFVASVCYVAWDISHGSGGLTQGRQPGFTTRPIEEFQEFPVYWVGDEYMGHELVRIDIDGPQGDRTWSEVRLGYGRCELPRGEGGCSLPLTIWLSPSCDELATRPIDPSDLYSHYWTHDVSIRIEGSGGNAGEVASTLRVANGSPFPDQVPTNSTDFVEQLDTWCDTWRGVSSEFVVPDGVTPDEQQQLTDFRGFPILWFGNEIDGLKLVDVRVEPAPPEDSVIHLTYGSCAFEPWAFSCGLPPLRLTLRSACAAPLWEYPGGVLEQFDRGIYVASTADYPAFWAGAATADVDADEADANELAKGLSIANGTHFETRLITNLSGVEDALKAQCSDG
jgi:hypothetical protein